MHGGPAQRVAGGWREVLSSAADHGVLLSGRQTRREDAAVLGAAFPAGAESVSALARRADAGVFGPGDPAEPEVQAYWKEVEGVRARLDGSVGFWRRQRARYSLRSLRLDRRLDGQRGNRQRGILRGLRARLSAVTRRRSAADGREGPLG
jgi:hypothetical protein